MLFSFCTSLASLAPDAQGATKLTAKIKVVDKEVGKTMRYLGASGMVFFADRKTQAKYIKDSGFNTTKYWEIGDGLRTHLGHRRYLYGKNTKTVAIRQATHELDDIDWALELFGSEGQMKKMAAHYAFLKREGVVMLINFVVKRRLLDQRDEEILWRWVFLYHIWANKIKKFDYPIWEVGCENDRRHSLINTSVGSDALREAEKITGKKILVGAAGHHDWKKVSLHTVLDQILADKSAKNLDALSYHSFAYHRKVLFPKLIGYPTFPEWHKKLDAIQKKHGKNLPWWDTSWSWTPHADDYSTPWGPQPGVKAASNLEHAELLTAIESASRILWENQCGFEYSCIYKLFSPEKVKAGLIKVHDDGSVRETRSYHAMRMIARSTVSDKKLLAIDGAPKGHGLIVEASRDKTHTYLTLINRHSKGNYEVDVALPSALKGLPYNIRELSYKVGDEQVSIGTLPSALKLKLGPLSIKQVIITSGAK